MSFNSDDADDWNVYVGKDYCRLCENSQYKPGDLRAGTSYTVVGSWGRG